MMLRPSDLAGQFNVAVALQYQAQFYLDLPKEERSLDGFATCIRQLDTCSSVFKFLESVKKEEAEMYYSHVHASQRARLAATMMDRAKEQWTIQEVYEQQQRQDEETKRAMRTERLQQEQLRQVHRSGNK
jgi:hypothetical protein